MVNQQKDPQGAKIFEDDLTSNIILVRFLSLMKWIKNEQKATTYKSEVDDEPPPKELVILLRNFTEPPSLGRFCIYFVSLLFLHFMLHL